MVLRDESGAAANQLAGESAELGPLGKPLRLVALEGLERLRRYSLPGNVRELQNVLERACVLAGGDVVEVVDALRADAPATGGVTAALPGGGRR